MLSSNCREGKKATEQTGNKIETNVKSGNLSWMRRKSNGDMKIPQLKGLRAATCGYREGKKNERGQRNHIKRGGLACTTIG